MTRLLRLPTRHPAWVLAAVLALSVLAASRLVDLETGRPRLVLDPSIDSMLPRNDEGRRFYDHVRRLFGSDETLIVVLHGEDIFSAENLGRIQRLTTRLGSVHGVHHVVSLSNALHIRAEDGGLSIAPLVDEIPTDPAELARIRREALADPLYAGNLVSHDGRSAAVVVSLLDMTEQQFFERGIDDEIARIAAEESGDTSVWLTGGAHIKAEMTRLLLVDLGVLVPLAFLVMSLVALLAFRSWRGVLVPVSTMAISLLWTLAILAELTGRLNQVTVATPPILLVVGFSYAIHIVSAYYDELRASPPPEEPVAAALDHIWLPVFLTGVTTAVGFLSLGTSRLDAIQEFAVYTALGVTLTIAVSLLYAPALLALLPRPRRVPPRASHNRVDRWLERLAVFDDRHRSAIVAAVVLVCVAAVVGMTRIHVSTDFVANFRPRNPVRQDFEAVNRHFEGSNSFFVVLQMDDEGAFKEPANLALVDGLQQWLTSQPEIGGTTSLVDYVKVINRGFHGDDPAALTVPDSRQLVSQLLFFGANEELKGFVDSRYQTANILVRSSEIDSGKVLILVKRIEEHLRQLPQRMRGTVTGNTVLVSKTADDIALGQALSLSTAFVIIYAILSLLFTSFRVGFLALLPNVVPLLIYFGVLGFSGATLNTTTGLVACLVFGIAVDDTIVIMTEFNSTAKRLADERQGVIEALRNVGRPVTFTTLALCLGFLVLTASQLRNQMQFGALASFTLFMGWIADMTFTPAIAGRLRIVTLWDVLSLDLGDDPHRAIPLFRGLRKSQARIAALMATIRSARKGERLVHLGDEGDEMYVVIDGELSASVPGETGRVHLRTLRRGDVVGEVALFHRGRRSADVDALSDARLLCLRLADLERLRRRYPRTGAQIAHNLNEVLAARLVSLTERAR